MPNSGLPGSVGNRVFHRLQVPESLGSTIESIDVSLLYKDFIERISIDAAGDLGLTEPDSKFTHFKRDRIILHLDNPGPQGTRPFSSRC